MLSCAILQGSIKNNQKIFLIKFEGHSTRKTDWPKKTENVITCYVKIIFRKFYGYIRNQCDLLYMLGKKISKTSQLSQGVKKNFHRHNKLNRATVYNSKRKFLGSLELFDSVEVAHPD